MMYVSAYSQVLGTLLIPTLGTVVPRELTTANQFVSTHSLKKAMLSTQPGTSPTVYSFGKSMTHSLRSNL